MRALGVFGLLSILLFGAGSAGAFTVKMNSNYDGVSELGVSDTIQVHVFLDAPIHPVVDRGLTAVSVAIEMDRPELSYDPAATIALPSGSTYANPYPYGSSSDNGSQQAYILANCCNQNEYPLYPVPPGGPWSNWISPPPG